MVQSIHEELFANAEIEVFGSVQARASLIEARMKGCRERGHHRTDGALPDKEGPYVGWMLCYDCEHIFEPTNSNYRIEFL